MNEVKMSSWVFRPAPACKLLPWHQWIQITVVYHANRTQARPKFTARMAQIEAALLQLFFNMHLRRVH
jgi:hypothetical protein